MKTLTRCLLALLCLGLMLTPAPSFAKKKSTKKDPPPHEYPKIESVNVTASTITVYDPVAKEATKYTVDKLTTITLANAPATLADLKEGMRVEFVQRGSLKIAGRIDAQNTPQTNVTAKKKKKG